MIVEPSRSATKESFLTNPYRPSSSTLDDPDSVNNDARVKRNNWLPSTLYGAAFGVVVWVALLGVHGFHSSFGNSLTRLYGRDLQNANLDWVLLLPICAIAGATALLLSTVVVIKTRIQFGQDLLSRVKIYGLVVGISTSFVASIFAWICSAIGEGLNGPVLLASGVTAVATFACVPELFSSK